MQNPPFCKLHIISKDDIRGRTLPRRAEPYWRWVSVGIRAMSASMKPWRVQGLRLSACFVVTCHITDRSILKWTDRIGTYAPSLLRPSSVLCQWIRSLPSLNFKQKWSSVNLASDSIKVKISMTVSSNTAQLIQWKETVHISSTFVDVRFLEIQNLYLSFELSYKSETLGWNETQSCLLAHSFLTNLLHSKLEIQYFRKIFISSVCHFIPP